MKHVIIYDNYDFLGMQAAQQGMTREEWIAHFGTGTAGVEESKHVMTYEKYIAYDKLGKWGKYSNESEVEDDLRMTVIRLFQYGAISNQLDDVIYTDQSSDKGIKWEIEVKGKGSDIIHAYKDGKMKGEYEWYLNKKKSSKYEIQQYFLNKYVSKLDQYIFDMKGFEIDKKDHRHFKSQDEYKAQASNLVDIYKELSKADQKKAYTEFTKKHKVDRDFRSFSGI